MFPQDKMAKLTFFGVFCDAAMLRSSGFFLWLLPLLASSWLENLQSLERLLWISCLLFYYAWVEGPHTKSNRIKREPPKLIGSPRRERPPPLNGSKKKLFNFEELMVCWPSSGWGRVFKHANFQHRFSRISCKRCPNFDSVVSINMRSNSEN